MSSAFKNLTHKMFLDTTFNSLNTVLSTIYKNFLESAMKYYRYAKCMATSKYPQAALLIGIHLLIICTGILPELLYHGRFPPEPQTYRGPPPLGTIQDVVDLAFVLVKAKSEKQIVHDYKCAVSKRQVEW